MKSSKELQNDMFSQMKQKEQKPDILTDLQMLIDRQRFHNNLSDNELSILESVYDRLFFEEIAELKQAPDDEGELVDIANMAFLLWCRKKLEDLE